MKNYLLVLFALLMFAGCKETKKNEEAPVAPDPEQKEENNKLTSDNTIIYIKVMDDLPLPGEFGNQKTIYDYVILFDNHGNISSNDKVSITAFASPVYKNKKVKWIKSNDSNKEMKIKITKKSKSENKDFLKDKKSNPDGSIEFDIKVKDKNGNDFKKGNKEYYNIIIEINGKKYPPIDPVLEWHPQ